MKKILFPLVFLLFAGGSLNAQLTISVDAIPVNTPDDASIHIAGDFQGWDPGSPDYALTDEGDGSYEIILDLTPGPITFKFTRGSWDTVEGNENGGFLPDRTFNYAGGAETLNLEILSWEDVGGTNSTAAENVEILDPAFDIPQLNRDRRVWIYLPPDYYTSEADYKVLYMHDGQNLFDSATSFAGEWEVDETLNELFASGDEGCIVVGIDNGGIHRLDEYSPWVNPEYGGGEGAEYMDFIVNTLKPYVDENYRTRPEREWTGIMGSSMGGLISTYGGIEHSDVFSRIGAFSPSYWFANPEPYLHVSAAATDGPMRIYSIAGEMEGSGMVVGVNAMEETFEASGYAEEEHLAVIHSYGTHSESYWRGEFADAYQWLWDNSSEVNNTVAVSFSFFPNPARDSITLSYDRPNEVRSVGIMDQQGKLLAEFSGWKRQIDLSALPGAYLILLRMEDGTVAVQRVLRL